jgi:2-methylcitrate dehydratase PrpD
VSAAVDPRECYARGFHPTGVCGPIGAAVAVSRLLGLAETAVADAVAIAASSASGLLEFLSDGTWTKRFHAGQAAANGIRAARLAAAGFSGPATALDGPQGFLHAFGGSPEALVEALGRAAGWGVRSTAVKLYPCCRYMHGCIDLLLDVAADRDASDVVSVRCGVLSGGWSLVADPPARKRRIASDVDAQFSMPFGAALALTRGRVTLPDFEAAADFAAEAQALIGAVECFRSEVLDAAYPEHWGAEVEVTLRDGDTIVRDETDFRGSAHRPASRTTLIDKAAGLIGTERARALFACDTSGTLTAFRNGVVVPTGD